MPRPALLDDVELLRRLVAFDTVSRNSNLPFADFVAEYLDRPGIRVRRNLSPDEQKANLVVELGPETGPDREGLVLCGHMDVVPAEEREWTSDPFTLTPREERLHARGAADMKGFLAVVMNRLATADPTRLRHPLALLFTYDEELGTLGAEHFTKSWSDPEALPRHVVIGEPTSLRPVRMHKGHLKLRITFRGVSAHSGYPHLGRNAIEPAARAVAALSALRAELEAERPEAARFFPEVPYVALNVGQIAGGVAVNVVPDQCTIEVGVRVLPGLTGADLAGRVRGAVARALGHADFEFEITGDSPPFLLDPDRPVHRHVCAVAGTDPDAPGGGSVAFATDAGWLQTVGFDCVIWGPGTIEVAHKPNEWVPMDQLSDAADRLDELVHRLCVAE